MQSAYDLDRLYRRRANEIAFLVFAVAVVIFTFWIRLDATPFGIPVMIAAIIGVIVIAFNLLMTMTLINRDRKLDKGSEVK